MIKKFLVLFFIVAMFSSRLVGNELDSLMSELDKVISESKTYQDSREMRIGNLKNLMEISVIQTEQEYLVISKLFEEYRAYNFDSALHYINVKIDLTKKLNKPDLYWEAKLQQSDLLSATGMYKESVDVMENIKRNTLPVSLIPKYYASKWLTYSQLARYTRRGHEIPDYNTISALYKDSLLSVLDPCSFEYKKAKEIRLYDLGKIGESREIITTLLAKMNQGTPEYAFFAYRMAMTYNAEKNRKMEKKYLILSAISDIRAAIKDNASLTLLAMRLYEEKKINKAYDYIQFSMNDALFFNAPLRFIEISNILPLINEAYQIKSEKQKDKLRFYLLLISFLTVFLIFSLVFIFMQMKKLAFAQNDIENANERLSILNQDISAVNARLKDLNLELSETNHIKELYIGHFLSRCSSYIDKLENYQKMVNRNITSKKIAELFETTKSNKLIEKELAEFYENFDTTFLTIYPDFVQQFNSLLNEEDRIAIRKGELLNTELRIFALIRLGINDSSKIAALLRYSVNTIYNYRVKIKNKASVPRDDFEDLVMKIGTFSK